VSAQPGSCHRLLGFKPAEPHDISLPSSRLVAQLGKLCHEMSGGSLCCDARRDAAAVARADPFSVCLIVLLIHEKMPH
jgi:hypothetical protein